MSYFNYATGLTMTSKKFDTLFGGPPRKPESKLTQKEMDLASSIQKVLEEIILLAKEIIKLQVKKPLLSRWCSPKLCCQWNFIEKKYLIIFGSNQPRVMRGALGSAYLHYICFIIRKE